MRPGQIAGRLLHVFLHLAEIGSHLVLLVRELAGFRAGLRATRPSRLLAVLPVLAVLPSSEGLAQPIGEITLLISQPIGALRKIVQLRSGLLLPQPVHHPLRFGQPFRRAPGIGLSAGGLPVLLGRLLRRAHVVHGLVQPVERLL